MSMQCSKARLNSFITSWQPPCLREIGEAPGAALLRLLEVPNNSLLAQWLIGTQGLGQQSHDVSHLALQRVQHTSEDWLQMHSQQCCCVAKLI